MTTDPVFPAATTGADDIAPIVTRRQPEIAELCSAHGVRALYVFGSAANGLFDDKTSDLDFIVDLGEYEPTVAARYARIFNGLSELFGRDIHLITTRARGNQHFLDEITSTRKIIYAT